ncbi:MAG TPA: YHS domain-containing protein [Thermodesulfobacteriota bacterium]
MPTVRDPVCRAQVDADAAAHWSNYQGLTYFFCSDDCRRRFEQSPEQYVGRR